MYKRQPSAFRRICSVDLCMFSHASFTFPIAFSRSSLTARCAYSSTATYRPARKKREKKLYQLSQKLQTQAFLTLIAKMSLKFSLFKVVPPILQGHRLLGLAPSRNRTAPCIRLPSYTNAHSKMWGHETNNRGAKFEDIIQDYDLQLHNVGRDYTFECKTGKSVINITCLLYTSPSPRD